MTDLSPDARRLVDATRAVDVPGASERARLRAALAERLVAPPAAATPAITNGLLAKVVVGGALVAALGVGAVRARTVAAPVATHVVVPQTLPPPPSSAPSPSIATLVERAPAAPVESPPPPALPAPARRAVRRPLAVVVNPEVAIVPAPPPSEPVAPAAPEVTPPAPSVVAPPLPAMVHPFRHELDVLNAAQMELDHHRNAQVLRRLDEYAAAHPTGALGQEALALRVLALCALGRSEEARGYATRLLGEAPRSPSANRVRGSCVGDGR